MERDETQLKQALINANAERNHRYAVADSRLALDLAVITDTLTGQPFYLAVHNVESIASTAKRDADTAFADVVRRTFEGGYQ